MLKVFLLFVFISTNGFVTAFRSSGGTPLRSLDGWRLASDLGDGFYRRTRRTRSSSPSVVTKEKPQAQALELKIDPPITLSSQCYFERDKMCKSGICPIDNRPCNCNRNYLDDSYKSAAVNIQQQLSLEDQEWQQQLQQWRQNNQQDLTTGNRIKRERNMYDDENHNDHERLRLDIMEDEPRREYPAKRFFNDVVDTVRIVVHIGKLVAHAVVYQVHNFIQDNVGRGRGR